MNIEVNDDKNDRNYYLKRSHEVISKLTGVYYELDYITEFELVLQVYDEEARVWLEANKLKGVMGMLYSFNLDVTGPEAFKFFNDLQLYLFEHPIKNEHDIAINFNFSMSDRRRTKKDDEDE